jgi:hypothetical protein
MLAQQGALGGILGGLPPTLQQQGQFLGKVVGAAAEPVTELGVGEVGVLKSGM